MNSIALNSIPKKKILMARYIEFKKKYCRRLKLNIDPEAKFSEILKILTQLNFPGSPVKSEHITYAVLELINNSMRAHRDKNIREKINADFEVKNSVLHIRLRDWGGGFNPENLPYDLYTNPEKIDLNTKKFQEYRKKHGYTRFGMGLYVVKKTFSSFRLYFIDKEGNTVPWDPDKTAGTCIELEMDMEKNGE
ncbi:MAG: ATP-binding protein [Spirochaetes bacterium]|nr:MAG: ATP-binding protein [Spirochaetota bacterium]